MRDEKFFQISINLLKDIFNCILVNKENVYIFGSSVRGDYNKYSDIDIAIENADARTITLLRDNIENLNIPYKIEIIDLNNISEEMKQEIYREGTKIWGS